jgi:prevent-host-death family protein
MKKTIQTVNIHEAKTQLSKLVDQAVKGEPFIIAKAGKPLVKVCALDAPSSIGLYGRADRRSR